MDIFIEKCGQYVHSLDFKVNLDDDKIIKGNIITIEPVKQITTPPQTIKLETTYLTLHSKDLSAREVIYDYKKQLTPQNCLPETLDLISSRVYAVKNPLTPNVNLNDVNLPANNLIQIPYNISRFVENNEVKESRKVFKNGKYVYPLNWASELQNNELFSVADKCYSLKFSTKTQLKAFEEKLKTQQIGSIENYPTINSQGQIQNIPRTYSRISQWVNRSSLNTFTDVRFTYTVDGDINTITICPSKECTVGPTKIGSEEGLYTSSSSSSPTPSYSSGPTSAQQTRINSAISNATTSGEGSKVDVDVIGNNNAIYIDQAGEPSYLLLDVMGNTNVVDIDQDATGTTSYGHYSEVIIDGDRNDLDLLQSGAGNKAAFVDIDGDDNVLDIIQKDGGNHYLQLDLIGDDHDVDITQEGSGGHAATIELTNSGGGWDFDLTQSGNTNKTYSLPHSMSDGTTTSGTCSNVVGCSLSVIQND